MAKNICFGVNEIARKVKGVDFGVDEIARKVKKGYIGVSPNLVKNGDFSNGFENWNQVKPDYVNYEIEDGKCKLTPITPYTTNYVLLRQGFGGYKISTGNVAYYALKYKAKLTNSGAYVAVRGETLKLYSSETETFASTRTVLATDDSGVQITGINGLGEGDYIILDDVKIYDLTNIFGAGNEPTKEWCDANLEALEAKSVAMLFFKSE